MSVKLAKMTQIFRTSQAKKRQIYLEETYGGSMRELELLVSTFSVELDLTGKKSKAQSSKYGTYSWIHSYIYEGEF